MARRLSAVLITWNSAEYLSACAGGLRDQTWRDVEIIVVDNASTDGSADLSATLLPQAMVIRNATNAGFAAAANQGIAASTGEFVLMVNPDLLMHADYAATLIGELERDSSAGSATGKLLRAVGGDIVPTGVIDSTGIVMTRNGRHFDRHAGEPDREFRDVEEVFGVSGAAAMYRRAMLTDLSAGGEGPFDEDFFAYREDADLAWRARLRGWKAFFVPAALAWHVRRVTPERRSSLSAMINMHSVKNRFLLRWKNQGSYLAMRDLIPTLFRDLIVIGAAMTVERSSLPALGWLWRNRRPIAAKRELVQMRRKVSDRELARWFR